MERNVSFTELKQNLRAVKDAAREDVIHVFLKGKPGYVLCSFEVWERRIRAAERRGAYRANVEESVHESMSDVREGRMQPLHEVPGFTASATGNITESALRYLDIEYEGDCRRVLGQTLTELAQRPGIGMTLDVEYAGECLPIRRFSSPPCDILYTVDHHTGLTVYGFVRSTDADDLV